MPDNVVGPDYRQQDRLAPTLSFLCSEIQVAWEWNIVGFYYFPTYSRIVLLPTRGQAEAFP